MAIIPVRNLHAGGGVNLDQQPDSLPMAAFSSLVNARMIKAHVERIGGTTLFADSSYDPELEDSRYLKEFTRAGREGLLLITADRVFIQDDYTGWRDVTPSYSVLVDTSTWCLEQYGDVLVITSMDTEPFVLMPTATEFQPFTFWPAQYTAGRIFFYKNFAIGVNIEVNGDPANGFVIWSHPVIDGNVIDIEWTPAPTNLAGFNTLPDGTGPIIEGAVLRDSAILYTDRTAWRMDLTDLNVGTAYVFNFRRVFGDDGIYGPRCVVEINGQHLVVGLNHIYMHDGFNRSFIADQRCNEFFYSAVGPERIAFVTHYNRTQEVVISIGTQEFTQANMALVFNYYYNAWATWVFSTEAPVYMDMIIGPVFDADVLTWDDLLALGTTWDGLMTTTWDDLFPDSKSRAVYILDRENDVIYKTDQDTDDDIFEMDFLAERVDMQFDELYNNSETMRHVRRMLPKFKGTGQIRIQMGGRNVLNQPVRWEPEQIFVLDTDYKADFRITYRYPAYRLIQTFEDGLVTITGFDLDYSPASSR